MSAERMGPERTMLLAFGAMFGAVAGVLITAWVIHLARSRD